jgi:nicotinamide-nucleotide amidase
MPEGPATLARELLMIAKSKALTLVTAESCTAGQLCQTLSDAEGAADYFHGGFVTYTKRQKHRALGVSEDVLRTKGAVCPEVACAMAEAALERSDADLSVSITGVAGPERDDDGNPVGRVCIAVARREEPAHSLQKDFGNADRETIRRLAVSAALQASIAAAKKME